MSDKAGADQDFAMRKGGQGPVIRCWLEQIGNYPGSAELSQAGILMGQRREGEVAGWLGPS